jgi:hypothetical protein
MGRNVQAAGVLTFLAMLLTFCKTDQENTSGSSDPETEYLAEYDGSAAKWGFLDTAGTVVIRARYDQVSGFAHGLAPANLGGRWGYIDSRDSVIIPFRYRAAWQFRGNYGRVMRFDGSSCFVDRRGKEVCPENVTELSDFNEGLAVAQVGNVYGYIDTSGRLVIPPQFEQATVFVHGSARVYRDGKSGLIDRSGTFILPPVYEKVHSPSCGHILVKQDDSYHFVSQNGERTGNSYRQATPYVDSVAAVADGDGWYLIDMHERPVTDERYLHLRPANARRWIARKETGFGVLDHYGTPLTPFHYQQINNYSEEVAGYERDELWGYLDLDGHEIMPPQYGLVWDFHEGFARAAFRDGIAFINIEGLVPFAPVYAEMRDFSEGLVPFQEH